VLYRHINRAEPNISLSPAAAAAAAAVMTGGYSECHSRVKTRPWPGCHSGLNLMLLLLLRHLCLQRVYYRFDV